MVAVTTLAKSEKSSSLIESTIKIPTITSAGVVAILLTGLPIL
jgi:hypothetical protein